MEERRERYRGRERGRIGRASILADITFYNEADPDRQTDSHPKAISIKTSL